MPHYRSKYRRLARAALAAHPHFTGVDVRAVWPGSVSDEDLPVMGVLTPQELSKRDTQKTSVKRTLMQVALRRIGGDEIEDQLDDDSAVVEAVIVAALRSCSTSCVLEDTSTVSNGGGRANVGTLVMSFRIKSWRSDPPHS
ncbi:MAG: hypothetical protein ACJZ88_00110 [Paracoccus marcusii]